MNLHFTLKRFKRHRAMHHDSSFYVKFIKIVGNALTTARAHRRKSTGMTDNAGRETNGRNCRHKIAGHENAGHVKQDMLL